MITGDKFRLGVGMVVCNKKGEVLWAKRIKKELWQFPQGGIIDNETPEEAVYRETEEELGLVEKDIHILGHTQGWLTYLWPDSIRLTHVDPHCLGQKQKWFLIRLTSEDETISLHHSISPEFDQWRWVDYWHPINHVISFKREVYYQALHELAIYRTSS